MSQKETIVNMLKTNGTMTQGALAEAIYGDKNHGPNIYATLIGLVKNGAVLRTGSNPSYYSLSGTEIIIPEKSQKSTKGYRDVSGDIITNEAMEEAEKGVEQISDVVQSNSAASEQCSATSQELSAQSESLNELTSAFILRND